MLYPQTQALIQQQLIEQVYPGVVYGFWTPTQEEQHAYGYKQILPERQPMTPDTLFDVASLTKVIGPTTLCLRLLEQGKLDLDQPLARYLTGFNDTRLTLRHLLTHTGDILTDIPNRDQLSASALAAAYLTVSAGPQIGKKVTYTDTGMILLGFLLAEYYQEPIQPLIHKQVLTPLGMSMSTFYPERAKTAATECHPTRGLLRGEVHDIKAAILKERAGHAGLFSSYDDCLRFAKMLVHNGLTANGNQFLQASTVQFLQQDWTPTGTLGRSLGWDLLYPPTNDYPLLYHTGYTGTFLLIDLEKPAIWLFLSNRIHPLDHKSTYLTARDQLIQTYLKERYC